MALKPEATTGSPQCSKRAVPKLPPLAMYAIPLAKMVADTGFLPDARTVECMGGAVFPTLRNSQKRVTPIERNGTVVGMYDDNTTPRWALLWSHGIAGVSKSPSTGWTFAHIWPSGEDLDAYTNLANLAMIPECFASLTDKCGPLTQFLRWHAWSVYRWKPAREPVPQEPPGYDQITWNYFPAIESPRQFVLDQIQKAGCARSRILKPLMCHAAP